MARLDKSIDDINKIVARRVGEKINVKTEKLKNWNGKKIIPVKEWHKIADRRNSDCLNYFPDTFLEGPIFFGSTTDLSKDARQKWYNEYLQYLEHVGDRNYGRHKCDRCILNPKVDITPRCFRGFVVDGLKDDMSPQFPCTVINMFECPYGEKKDILLAAKIFWEIIHEALRYGRVITSGFDDTYHIDYEKKIVGYSPDNLHYTIDESLGKIIVPAIAVRTKKEIHEILTNKKKLDAFLEQYVTGLASGNYTKYKQLKESKTNPEQIKKYKEEILEFFDQIKDSIKIDEMGDLYVEGFTEKEDHVDDSGQVKSGTCSCGAVARVHCVNCDSWICLDHWREHGKVHNYVPSKK